MADVKAVDERAELPDKRRADLPSPVIKPLAENKGEPESNKRQKLQVPSEKNGVVTSEEDEGGDEEAKIVDRKGKGIMVDYKGKGKMLEDSEDEDDDDDDDDDDSSDDSDSSFSDDSDASDFEDDPLAEVDLDNILPSETRRSQAQPPLNILGDSNKGNDV